MSSKYKKKIENLKRVQHHTCIHKKIWVILMTPRYYGLLIN